MKITKFTTLLVCNLTLLVSFSQADKINRTHIDPDDNWTNEINWARMGDGSALSKVPGPDDVIRIVRGVKVRVTTEVEVGAVHISSEGSGSLIVDGGKLTALLAADYNSISYAKAGTVIVQNGGSVTFYGRTFVGKSNAPSGSLTIYEGSVRVAHYYAHNDEYEGTETLNTKTIIHTGGLLDVDELKLNAGVMDVAGGTVVVRQPCEELINDWVKEGRIVAMSGVDGWHIKVTVDEITGWTTIVAESEPITLG